MTSGISLPMGHTGHRPASPGDLTRRLYVVAAILLLAVVFLGFRPFYLHGQAVGGRPLPPAIRGLLITHGIAMTGWMLLLMTQSLLVATRRTRLHMKLGGFGVALAVCIFVLGTAVGIEATRTAPPDMQIIGMPMKQFMAVPLISVAFFAALIAFAVVYRRRPEVHRPLMLVATLATMGAPSDRYEPIASLYYGHFMGKVFGPYSFGIAFGLAFLLAQWALTRHFDRHLAVYWALLCIVGAGTMAIAPTALWAGIANALL